MATGKKTKTAAGKGASVKNKPTKLSGQALKQKAGEKKQAQKRKASAPKTKKVAGPSKAHAKKKVKSGKTGTGEKAKKHVAEKKPSAPLGFARGDILRKQLIQKREEIVREAKAEIAKYTKGEAAQLVETALDDGDWSVIDLSADINIRRLETHRERLLGIDAALIKLKEGTYGICEECGGEITAERLRVLPFAVYCRDCQEKREQLEKVAREEIIS